MKEQLLEDISRLRTALQAATSRIPAHVVDGTLSHTRAWKETLGIVTQDYHFKYPPSSNVPPKKLESIKTKLTNYLERLQ